MTGSTVEMPLLPTVQAEDLQRALVDYLRTTFALADVDAQVALEDFLRHDADGIFKGPYVRLRLPFRPANDGWETLLDWMPEGFMPYGHQADAFRRLCSRGDDGDFVQPQPTLVTTGTGSGKTEAFLYPILDHVLRARAAGVAGTKALILYPMNALANDQAQRLAGLISGDRRLSRVTAALYTGEDGPKRTQVTAEGLITDRGVIRDQAPDILLTNYKMLDQLLLRADDQPMWQQSATSLTYLILDEFHTYDGAQGTDVAMLLRRLSLTLGDFGRPAATNAAGSALVPVATSATLGDNDDPHVMIEFASTIFGREFDTGSVVTESRQPLVEWAGRHQKVYAPPEEASIDTEAINKAVRLNGAPKTGQQLTRAVIGGLYRVDPEASQRWSDVELSDRARQHPMVQRLVGLTGRATSVGDAATAVLGAESDPASGAEFVTNLVAALSQLRAALGRDFVSVETHLWVRELTRIDRVAGGVPRFRWSDDGRVVAADAVDVLAQRQAFPAVYCRHCGRSGWGIELVPTGSNLGTTNAHEIRARHAVGEGRFRALIFAAREAQADGQTKGLAWFDVRDRQLLSQPPGRQSDLMSEGWVLPVLRLVENPDADSRDDRCPACDRTDGIRFLGSAVATLLSVSLSALFGARSVSSTEKKALVFTDSVQDAAHRAGFVESRSHTLTLRAAIHEALDRQPVSLDLVVDEMIRQAGEDKFRRYRLLPPDTIGRKRFDEFWSKARLSQVPNTSRQWVRRRLLFDVVCEFGVHSRVGRTLEATGAAAVEVDAGNAQALLNLGRSALLKDVQPELPDVSPPSDQAVVAWVRGVLEHLRTQGAIDHDWLSKYIADDGSRYRIWGGRAREQGMPAFPSGRAAPAFPRIGPKVTRKAEMLLDVVTSPQSWFARWSGRVLGVEPGHGARLARALLERLHAADVLAAKTTNTGGTVYSLSPAAVTVTATTADAMDRGEHVLRCSICRTEQYGSATTTLQLDGAPCVLVRCAGVLERSPESDNYYRRLYASSDMRRVVAREHTGLLDDSVRLAYETGFKSSDDDPSAPNVLVATPTLEMGIDIGDLSAVVLASLPRTVASYLQRVGRAGRLTGNALDLAFVTGRGQNLPRLADPSSLIDGVVRPPATYLNAEEILRRQYLASLVDSMARDPHARHPARATAAMQTPEDGSFLGALISLAELDADRLLGRFLAQFRDLDASVTARLRAWARADPGIPRSSGLAAQVMAASAEWSQAVESLQHRQHAIELALPELQQRASAPAHGEDDERAARAAEASLRQTKAALGALRGAYWIQVLEEYGLLPNYTLLSDNVTLDVALSWLDPETQQYDSAPTQHRRGSGLALREFAPGATFYGQGMQIEIDAVDLGTNAESVHEWELCAECGFAREAPDPLGQASTVSPPCPRCGSAAIQDASQRFKVVELTRVSAQAHRDEARINDRTEERRQTRFSIVSAADIDPAFVTRRWFVDGYGFGARYLRRLTLRWFNVGRRTGVGPQRGIAGETVAANLFRLCVGCGVLDRTTKSNRPDEHRAWCRYRTELHEHTESLVLSRTLVTQAAVIPLPWSVSLSDALAVPSLEAAILLGLRERFGGAPDHIGVVTTVDPVIGGDNRTALLLHDLVPGGTGYLAELATPQRVWELLRAAWNVVSTCPCQDEGLSACHRCLLPFAPPGRTDVVSRSAAERHLRELLTLGTDAQEPPEEMTWTCTEEEPVPAIALESHLELYFRRAFTELVTSLSAAVTEIPGPKGTSVQAVFPGSRTWLLEPQVNVLDSKPDFILSSTDTQVPKMAIFTDGYAYHASPAHRATLALDAGKRRNLRDAGYFVLSITAADLGPDPASPTWWSATAATALVGRAPSTVAWLPRIKEGPLSVLRAWLLDPSAETQQAWANVLPLMLAAAATPVQIDMGPNLAQSARQALSGGPFPADGVSAYWWRQGPLGVLVRSNGAGLEMAAVLDDGAAAVDHHDFRAGWRDWLSLGNSVQLATIPVSWGTSSSEALPAGAAAPDLATVAAAWRPLLSLAETDLQRQLITYLAEADVAPPSDLGEEVEGVLTDLSWPEQRVAVIYDDVEAELVDELAAAGWQLVRPEGDLILTALREGEGERVA
ncbi:DEAD/DEAH box helicase [Microlunatus spumicola]|uniref:DEAD/DEAH box helicase n=1 Tax=Microlunatus spumicola TaxID=81499 RepID=A0ABP6XS86_9ACTN